jgi:hypothetical protein
MLLESMVAASNRIVNGRVSDWGIGCSSNPRLIKYSPAKLDDLDEWMVLV